MLKEQSQTKKQAKEFWNYSWSNASLFKIEQFDFKNFQMVFKQLEKYFSDKNTSLEGKNILEIGCGKGAISVYLARGGANVTAIDDSNEAIEFVKKLAKHNNVEVNAFVCDAYDIYKFNNNYDIIIGRFILHHLEPFEKFISIMRSTMKNDGYAIFYENNSRNKILLFIRNHIVGKFNIPKYGDADEFPLEPKEIEIIRKEFRKVNIIYPRFYFFDMLSVYLFKRNKLAHKIFMTLDIIIFKYFKSLHKFSYEQIIEIYY